MKLYATTTSERASKGQGGDYLDIVIYNQEKKPSHAIRVRCQLAGRVSIVVTTDIRYGASNLDSPSFIEEDKCTHDYDNYGKCTECGQWKDTKAKQKKGDHPYSKDCDCTDCKYGN